ncbi:MAG: DUF2911 domain-containing protein [Bacteroidia bacterium]
MKHVTTFMLMLLMASMIGIQAQSVTLPPSGANQQASVTQHMGLVKITIDYSSPDVTAPNGDDRRGKIWGGVVHYGMRNLGFGPAESSPWRAGANKNTVITFSHDVEIEGKRLAAGKYGLHMMAAEEGKPWTIIFSNNTEAWGSYFYDVVDDALRVEVKPVKNAYNEWLTYSFDNRQQNTCTAYLAWEELKVPFVIAAPKSHDYYVNNLRQELQSRFGWQDYLAAANYCLQNSTHLEQGMTWANTALSGNFIGQKNFTTLSTKAAFLMKMDKEEEALKVMDEAVKDPTASVGQIHQFGRQLITMGKKDKALEVFKMNAERFPDTWPVNVGLVRGYSAVGDYKKALKYAKMAKENVPANDSVNKQSIDSMIEKLAKGEDIN